LSLYGSGLLHEEAEGVRSPAALSNFLAAAAAAPDESKLQSKAAVACLIHGRVDDAMRILEADAQRHPDSSDSWMHLATVCRYNGRRQDAIAYYRRALTISPDSSPAYLNLAGILREEKRDREAFDAILAGFENASDTDLLHDACVAHAQEQATSGDVSATLASFEFLAKHSPRRRSFYQYFVGSLHAEVGNSGRAMEYIRQATEGAEPYPDAFLWLAMTLAPKEPAKAVAILADGICRFPDNDAMLYFKASLHEKLGETDKARLCLASVSTNSTDSAVGVVRLALAQLRTDRVLARQTLQDANRSIPDKPIVMYPLATLLLGDKEYAEAATLFTRIISLLKTSGHTKLGEDLYFNCGAACERAGRNAEAEQIFSECIAVYPDHNESLNYLAYMWAERGANLEQAAEYATRALRIQPENPAYIDTLGWIYYRQRKFKEARALLEAAFLLMADDPTIAEHLGDVFMALNRPEDAVTQWTRSFVLDPAGTAVANKLEKQGVRLEPLRAEAEKFRLSRPSARE
jgi:tetratricopeptide (TPR) repeat protein